MSIGGWGGMLSYGQHSLSQNEASGKIRDGRLGVYGLYNNHALTADVYLAYGRQNNEALRRYGDLAEQADSNYHSNVFELGIRTAYALGHGRDVKWRISPYGEARLARYSHNGWREIGAGVYGQQADSEYDSITELGLGLEFMRDLGIKGRYGVDIGYRRIVSGTSMSQRLSFAAAPEVGFDVTGQGLDKHSVVASIRGDVALADNCRAGGELRQRFGADGQDVSATVQVAWSF